MSDVILRVSPTGNDRFFGACLAILFGQVLSIGYHCDVCRWYVRAGATCWCHEYRGACFDCHHMTIVLRERNVRNCVEQERRPCAGCGREGFAIGGRSAPENLLVYYGREIDELRALGLTVEREPRGFVDYSQDVRRWRR